MASEYVRSKFSSWREYLTPINHESTFSETGEITPEEFVQAGDFLVAKFPTWQWSPAPEAKRREFLPDDKQFLVTRHVPSYVRASDYEKGDYADDFEDDFENGEEGWTSAAGTSLKTEQPPSDEPLPDEPLLDEKPAEYDDIDDLIDEDAEDIEDIEEDEKQHDATDTKGKRSYDLYITYSTSYRVPKMYLVGFNSDGAPLKPEQMFEDIASDYRHKTVTIEKAPFLADTTVVSIHPCRHATVMRALMKMAAKAASKDELVKGVSKLGLADNEEQEMADDDWQDVEDQTLIRADQYLVIFLKFMASVTPGIEHDYTMDAL